MNIPAARHRARRAVIAGAAVLLMAMPAKAESALHPPVTLDTGLVVLVPGEAMVIRAHASTRAKSRVVVQFFDAQDNEIASSTQIAEPGQPTMARLPYGSVPGAGAPRVARAETRVTPLDVLAEPTAEDGTTITTEAYGDLHARAIPCSGRPPAGGEGRDWQQMWVPQSLPGIED